MKIFPYFKHKIFLLHRKLLSKQERGFFSPLLVLLRIISWPFKAIVWCKNLAYEKNIFSASLAKVPVISVGNIVAGGTGKTPFVIKLIQLIPIENCEIGVLSRGYGAKGKKDCKQSWENIGDEPKLISDTCKGVQLLIGKNRRKNAQKAKGHKLKLLILDDGLQYRSLKKDFEIILLNSHDLFGQTYFLPRGYLRDYPSRLKSADLIFVHHIEERSQFEKIQKQIQKYTKAPICAMRANIDEIIDLQERKISIKNEKIGMFCAIADPLSFIKILKKEKAHIVHSKIYSDHQEIPEKSLQAFAQQCKGKGAKRLVCTQKDQIKLSTIHFPLPIAVVKIKLEIVYGNEYWDLFIEKICNLVDNLQSHPSRN